MPCIPARNMGMVKFPTLIFPSNSPDSGSQRIYLAFVVNEFQPGSTVNLSQRGTRKLFNRGGGGIVSKDLRELRAAGWLLARQIEETEALGYSPGKKLTGNPALYEEWQGIAAGLFGKQGLVKQFVNTTVWGHGVFGFKQILVLGALVYREQKVRRMDLVHYLGDWMSESTIDSALRKMVDAKIVSHVDGFYVRTQNWNENLQIFAVGHPGGEARRQRVRSVVAKDRYRYGMLAREGKLTPRQRKELLKNPCVRCDKKSTQEEHFPPTRLGGKSQIHLVWAICKPCNDKTKAFIKKIDLFELVPGKLQLLDSDVDPNDMLRASLSVGLGKFYRAAEKRDYVEGRRIVEKACSLIQSLEADALLWNRRKTRKKRAAGTRAKKGRRPMIRESSRLKY